MEPDKKYELDSSQDIPSRQNGVEMGVTVPPPPSKFVFANLNKPDGTAVSMV